MEFNREVVAMLDVRGVQPESRPNWTWVSPVGGGSGASCAWSQVRWFVAMSDRVIRGCPVSSVERSPCGEGEGDAARVFCKHVDMKFRMIKRCHRVFHPDEVPMFAGLP